MLIADDHAFTLEGMQQKLARDARFEVVAVASGGVDAIRLARKHRPDLAVLDYVMPDATGLEVLLEIRRWSPQTRVVILTGQLDAAIAPPLIDAGASGLLTKGADPAHVCDALAVVARGGAVFDPPFDAPPEPAAIQLTPREREVLLRIARGMSNPRIAEDLALSPKTVESHRSSLMRKLDVNSTATLMLRAAKAGLIEI
ncbi:response regulator [Poseidonocella sedimentorum]|uniref:DNA-binding response regulator, NarL/FixJ family, contains REC and HTH domains n=1 Tax=Poseidonocella sedimentorum TaxID=871652 RepID=A0A1I6ED90_9RHOB|nr:response regulator transcription factor [Poseidonocella sedimentorum]SFR15726.1 DNA-binding response regulator, NarL/FixJ family, contains REC and HTH domains [Poseidonocella sedimentorum]